MFIIVNPEKSYTEPNNDYWHKECYDCKEQFDGPKRASKCYPCSLKGEQLIFDFASL